MFRPYIVCHMVISIDGKVTGKFLNSPECNGATDIYYEINREYNNRGANGFICGRVTMESSFTGGWYPDLDKFSHITTYDDFIPNTLSGFMHLALIPKVNLVGKPIKLSMKTPDTIMHK